MGLTNTQYDTLMRQYNQKQLRNQHIISKRKCELYESQPRLKEIEQTLAHLSVEKARALLSNDSVSMKHCNSQIKALQSEKKSLLDALSLPKDYLTPPYDCPDCEDTGFISGKRCHCFKQAAINLVYTQSNIERVLEEENFSHFSFQYYAKDDLNPSTGLSSYETARRAVTTAKEFIAQFDQRFENLFLFGDTGVGKTFLSNCIAKELLDTGHSIIYLTAFQLFDIFRKRTFEKNTDIILEHQNIFDCDLLIIDDLGTETITAFTSSQFFLCINERILRHKSTIISTNMRSGQIKEFYSERTASRIMSYYSMIKLEGNDIRIQKKLQKK